MANTFKSVDTKVSLPELEDRLIGYWKENKIFEESVASKDAGKTWTFLDGPPFITGLPHYGSLLSSIPKDLFPRFWTMKGYKVRRVWGWDCHGLPAENKVENKLGLKRKKDIEEVVGVKKFIDECKLYVSEVSSEWEWYVDHVGRWVDFKNAYKTMDTPYMESVMWVFKSMYEKGYIYKGLRVSLYCPHCSTPISNFEVAMDPDNYKTLTDHGTTYKYELAERKGTFLLAWSTTPWNKLATPALAVNPELTYVEVTQNGETYILAKSTLEKLDGKYELIKEVKGSDLVGTKFVPHYDYYKVDEGKKAFVVVGADFVTADEGTGVVTIAAYGEEDLALMLKENIQIVQHVDDEGMVKKDVPTFGGKYYLKLNDLVNADLASRGLVYKDEEYEHTVPTCWRCHERLFYAPQNAWYVDVQKLKPAMEKTNEVVNWFPEHVKYGRFTNSMKAAPDWCISRSRYWGSPVPVWECECGKRYVPGSIAELEELSGTKIADLHKPEIDEIVIKCSDCGKNAKRVPEVLDSWIEAGSAAFAERHFPFDKAANLADFFPPDFIVEYTGQIRAWFYVLHVISTALYNTNAFKNVVVTGVILGTDGRKMSKNYGNYPDPKELLLKYGGDALRLYLMGSPVMHGEDILISEDEYGKQVRGTLLTLWNVYNFFVTYASLSGFMAGKPGESGNVMDKWISSLLNRLIVDVTKALEEYDTVGAVDSVRNFISDFSTWYIRRSRDRQTPEFFDTCYKVLTTLCRVMAPLTPFITEEMYMNLTNEKSVHLSNWPEADTKVVDAELEEQMQLARKLVVMVHAVRKAESIKVRQPLSSLVLTSTKKLSDEILTVVGEEVNVIKVTCEVGEVLAVELDKKITPELAEMGEGREIARRIQDERKSLGVNLQDSVEVYLESWPESQTDYIKKRSLVSALHKGEFKVVRSEQSV